jgi:hypothetical protein
MRTSVLYEVFLVWIKPGGVHKNTITYIVSICGEALGNTKVSEPKLE